MKFSNEMLDCKDIDIITTSTIWWFDRMRKKIEFTGWNVGIEHWTQNQSGCLLCLQQFWKLNNSKRSLFSFHSEMLFSCSISVCFIYIWSLSTMMSMYKQKQKRISALVNTRLNRKKMFWKKRQSLIGTSNQYANES